MPPIERPRAGDHLIATVEALGVGAAPTGHDTDGNLLAIQGGVPGDRVRVEVLHAGQNRLWTRVLTVLTPSESRVVPPCDQVDRCGACPWQSVADAAQRVARLTRLEGLLKPFAEDARWHPWGLGDPPDARTDYRTRGLLMARSIDGTLRLGFFAPRSNDLIPAESCVVQHPQVRAVMDETARLLNAAGLSTWAGAGDSGLIRAVLYRVDPTSEQGLLTLIVSREDPALDPLIPRLSAIPGVSGVFLNINASQGGAVIGPVQRHRAGRARQPFTIADLTLDIGPVSFLQTRHGAGETLVRTVSDWLPPTMNHLVDLYSGVGVFGYSFRDRAAKVTMVEVNAAAIADAQAAQKRLSNTAHISLKMGDVAAHLDVIKGADALIIDPPRAGLAPSVTDALCDLPGDPLLILVSCGPNALGRDIEALTRRGGFRVTDIRPVDMFPHTPHVETVLRLRRNESTSNVHPAVDI